MTLTDNPGLPLGDEIARALADASRTAADVARLLDAIEPAAGRLRADAAKARAAALDPRKTGSEVSALRQMAADLDFERDRIEAAREALTADLDALRAVEAERRREAAYDRAEREAERVAARIAGEYPDLAAALLDLIADVAEATAAVVAANRALPAGRAPLQAPEGLARGFPVTFGTAVRPAPMLLCEAVLPPIAPTDRALWPRERGGGGYQRDTRPELFDPFQRWPSAQDAARARAELEAQSQAAGLGGAALPTAAE